MTKIIVAGAGHGGLVAAAKLAKAGYEVTVYESKKEGTLGHDWEDRFTFNLLLRLTENDKLSENSWRYRGDCVFVSPSKKTNVEIEFAEENRHKLMWRKPLIEMLLSYAVKCGVRFEYETKILSPVLNGDRIIGILTDKGEITGDLVIDAAGFFSPIRTKLPDSLGIEKQGIRGDAFYAYRAYFNKTKDVQPKYEHEVYLYHECEQGLSWFCTNKDSVDVLIGRIDPINDKKVNEQLEIFRKSHDWLGDKILHGGTYGVIPVRRPLSLMVADGYAAVGDSAFMTTPMNGMGIDLSMLAGELLANTVIAAKGDKFSKENLWVYNREYHVKYGGETAKNEGLKNSLLKMPYEGVDFLFDNAVVQSSDLAGAGKNMNLKVLLGKFVRGMRNPKYFFALLGGLISGGKVSKLLQKAPTDYDKGAIGEWQAKISANIIKIDD